MKFTITVEVEDCYINEHLQEFNKKSRADLIGEINNTLYLGLSCIDAMLERSLELPSDSWVHTTPDGEWQYNDHYPTDKDFPITDIIQRAMLNEIEWDKKTIDFARQCWAECAIKHDIKTGEQ
jgi:hypothetical protein